MRAAVPRISTPTLILHRENSIVPVVMSRYLAREIKGAKYVEFSGSGSLTWVGDWEPMVDEIEEFLTGARHRAHPDRPLATILFTDIVSSTERASELGDERWRALVERHDDVIRTEIERYGGRPIKTLGDGFLAVFEGPAKAIRAARAMGDAVRGLGIEIRAGVHTGECERRGEDLAGIAVNVAARIIAHANAGEVLVSSTVRELVLGSGIEFVERGTYTLKGVPGRVASFAVTGDGRTDARPVSEVSPEVAALTPGPMETMRARDRAMLAAAHRSPGMLRTLGRPILHRQRPSVEVSLMAPETKYAKKGDISIAYQVVGDGTIDLVLVNGLLSHMALLWTDPQANAMLRRITSFARLVMFDKPGTGLSDPVSGPPSVEQRVEDIRVVMDAVGLEHAALWGYSEGGSPSILFAATYPERCDALIVSNRLPGGSRILTTSGRSQSSNPCGRCSPRGARSWGDGRVILDLWAPSAMSVPRLVAVHAPAQSASVPALAWPRRC